METMLETIPTMHQTISFGEIEMLQMRVRELENSLSKKDRK